MCGIAGTVSWPGQVRAALVPAAMRSLHHRGPNSSGVVRWQSPRCAAEVTLGATRLAVQDLQSRANQPMTSTDGRFTLIFNGEVTNFHQLRHRLQLRGCRFRTEGDTEVLLQGWAELGPSVLSEIEGFFAFAILDRLEDRLILARDAFGIKPLFISGGPWGVAFASELPSLLALTGQRPALDTDVAVDYLLWGAYDRGRRTFIAGIERAEQGTWQGIDLQRRRVEPAQRFWWPPIDETFRGTAAEAAGHVRDLVIDSVHRNLRSDVPVGVALSGGLDSSVLASVARYCQPDSDIATFSYIEPGSPDCEERWSSLVAAELGTEHHQVRIDDGDLRRDLDTLILAQGEPFGSTSIYAQYSVYRRVREEGIVVSLDGQGGDEVFAGYDGYPGPYLAGLVRAGRVRDAVRGYRNWSAAHGHDPSDGAQKVATALVPGVGRRVAGWSLRAYTAPLAALLTVPMTPIDPLLADGIGQRSVGRGLVASQRRALLGDGLVQLLRHGDRNSMHFSVESRVPLLDRRLVSFVLSLPEPFLAVSDGRTKGLLRAAMAGIVPRPVLERTDKIGFRTPQAAWLAADPGWASRMVAQSGELDVLHTDRVIRYLVQTTRPARPPFDAAAWRLVNLYRWASLLGVA